MDIDEQGLDPLRSIDVGLPNGLHDADLVSLMIDRENRAVAFVLAVDVNVDEGEQEPRYRRCRLCLDDVVFVRADTIVMRSNQSVADLSVDFGRVSDKELATMYEGALPQGVFAYKFYLHTGYASVSFAARQVRLEWLE